MLCAFDVIELDGKDLRPVLLEERKQTLAKPLRAPHPGIALNEHYVGDGDVYRQACKLGCEGIVSKRLGSVLPLRTIRELAEGQESGSAGGAAQSGR